MTETDNPEWPEGAIFLRDRSSDAVVHLADTSLSYTFYSPFSFIADDIVRLYLGGFGSQPQRFFSLTDGTSFDLPPGNQATARLGDGRWLMSGFWGYGPFALFDPASRTSEPLFEHEASLRWDGDRFLAVQGTTHELLNVWDKTGRLWSIELDGTRELLANRVSRSYHFLDESRVVDVLELDESWRGELVVVDTTSRADRRVDEKVVRGGWALGDSKTLLYGVSDGDRTGVWLARPAAAD